jgi:hypothetical protein
MVLLPDRSDGYALLMKIVETYRLFFPAVPSLGGHPVSSS